MEFKEIDSTIYNDFWNNHKLRSFLSSTKVNEIRKITGWDFYYVALFDENKIVAAAKLISHERHFKKKEFYIPRGPLIDYENIKYLTFFFKKLKQFIKKKNGYALRIDPYITDNKIINDNLKLLGFKKLINGEQDRTLYVLDVENKKTDEVFAKFKSNTKSCINKTQKDGITIRKLNYEELHIFYEIMKETGLRKNFKIKDLNYFKTFYQMLTKTNEVCFLVAEIDINIALEKLEKEINAKKIQLENLKKAKYNDGKRKELLNQIQYLEKKQTNYKQIRQNEKQNKVILSSSMFLLIKPEVIYFHSGNVEKYLNFNAQYLIQWEMIKYAINNGFAKYNFYGIPNNLDKNNKDYGIYEFKKGFNGEIISLIGEYEMPITKSFYIIKFLKFVKKILK